MALKPSYLVLTGFGALVAVSGLKGWKISKSARDVIAGQNPSVNAQLTAQITPGVFLSGYGYGTSAGTGPTLSGKGTGAGIPDLGTTLPPQATMNRYFGPMTSPLHETIVNFAGHRVLINRAIAGNLRQAGAAIKAAGLAGQIRDVGGFRTTKGGSGSFIPYSMHQYGAAIDINEDGGPNGNWHTMTLDPRLVGIMQQYHWFCGENWGGVSRDGGHFQFMGGG